MKVNIIGTLWRINTRDDGRMSVNISESRKNKQTGAYETTNSLWANVSGEAVEAINAVATQLEDPHKPFMTFEGYLNGYGVKNADGTYGNGRFTITAAKPFQSSNRATATPSTAPVPQAYAAPVPVSTPTPAPAPQSYANPTPNPIPAPAATSEMYAIPDDDDEELPFN